MPLERERAFPSVQLLLALREVFSQGSTNAAAKTLFRSQPAVSQAIRQAERYFGTRLFLRMAGGMEPTPAGTVALRRAVRALDHLAIGVGEPVIPGKLYAIGGAQLLALEAVAQEGGFGAAARATGLRRASLHRACRALEKTLGVALFETTSHGLECTRAGEALARRVSLATAELQQARNEIEGLGSAGQARIVIGAMPLARTSLVPDAVLRFAALHPHHVVTILDGPYETMLAALRRGAADLLVGALRDPLPSNDVVQEHLFDDLLAIVVRAGHPILAHAADPRTLRGYPWIAPRIGTPLREHFETLFKGVGRPSGLVECNSLSAARAILRASNHLMLLSAHQAGSHLDPGAFELLPHPMGTVLRHIGMTTRKDWLPTEVQAQFLDIMRGLGRQSGASNSDSLDRARKALSQSPPPRRNNPVK